MRMLPSDTIEIASSNLVDEAHPSWDGTTTWNVDDRVILDHVIYKALHQNTNVPPPEGKVTVDSVEYAAWERVGSVNSKRFYDEYVNSISTANDMIEFEFDIARCSHLFFLQMLAHELEVVVGGETVIHRNLRESRCRNMIQFIQRRWTYLSTKVIPVPYYILSTTATVRLLLPDGTAELGMFGKGTIQEVGISVWNPRKKVNSKSEVQTKNTITELITGNNIKGITIPITYQESESDYIDSLLDPMLSRFGVYLVDDEDGEDDPRIKAFGKLDTREVVYKNGGSVNENLKIEGAL